MFRPDRRRLILIGVGAAAAILIGAWALNRSASDVFGESGAAFGSSLARSDPVIKTARCRQQPTRQWFACEFETDAGSGFQGPVYRLVPEGDGCWTARKVHPVGARNNRRITDYVLWGATESGCLRLVDYLPVINSTSATGPVDTIPPRSLPPAL